MGLKNTPPYSPHRLMEEETDENMIMNDNEAFEVIDLDEVLGGEEDDEDETQDPSSSGVPAQIEVEDNSILKFGKHGKSVFCVDLRPGDRPIVEAVSGGEDDKAYIWDIKTGDVKFVCDGFKDSVTHVRFNHDGSLLAVADMSGVIRVYKMPSFSIVWEFETADITWMEWHSATNVLLAGTVESECWMWKIPSGDSKIYMGNGERVECAALLPDGKRIAVGYGGGSVKVFDLKTGDVQINSNSEGSNSSISCIDASAGFIGYGSVNGTAKIMALQSGKVIGTFAHLRNTQGASEEEMADADDEPVDNSIECLAFSKNKIGQQHLYTASLTGELNVWDLSTQVARHSSILGSGIVKILVRNKNPSQLFVATLDGVVIIYDSISGEVIGSCTGHTAAILDIQQSRDGSTLLSSSDDGSSRVFDLHKILNTPPPSS